MILSAASAFGQNLQTPDQLYEELFHDVQMARVFEDGKTFVDMVAKRPAAAILADYRKQSKTPGFNLKAFVEANFDMPPSSHKAFETKEKDIWMHARGLWPVLTRSADKPVPGSSLLPLPHPYIVAGGRFREVYYWDSYFSMLGMAEQEQEQMVENMVRNYAHMITTYGHVPNGNRTYYLSRSQPPFFSLMVELLADIRGEKVFLEFLPAMEKEYAYWTAGTDNGRVVRMPDGATLSRYWDEADKPRQESYREDVETAEEAVKDWAATQVFKNEKQREKALADFKRLVWRNLRSAAASGWDFSSRWLSDPMKLSTIRTTEILPVDLNCLLFMTERALRRAYSSAPTDKPDQRARFDVLAGEYEKKSNVRKAAMEKYFWNEAKGIYSDHDLKSGKVSDALHMAGMFPLYAKAADPNRGGRHARAALSGLLKDGGFQASSSNTGQRWDAPNGWAPLQWVGVIGLENYTFYEEARDAATRWAVINRKVFERTGKLMEKYNVFDTGLEGGGGEYPNQDGFGWTIGVLQAFTAKFGK
jgi:alpha,alpha-trehalase